MSRENLITTLTPATAKGYISGEGTCLEFDRLIKLQNPEVLKLFTRHESSCMVKRVISFGPNFRIDSVTSKYMPELMTKNLIVQGPIDLSREDTIKWLISMSYFGEIDTISLRRSAAESVIKLFNEGQITDEYLEETAKSMGLTDYKAIRLDKLSIVASQWETPELKHISTTNNHGCRVNRQIFKTLKNMDLLSYRSMSAGVSMEEHSERGGALKINSTILGTIVLDTTDEGIKQSILGLMNIIKNVMGLRTDTPAHFFELRDPRRGFAANDVSCAGDIESWFSLERDSMIKLVIEMEDYGFYFSSFKTGIDEWSASNMAEAYSAYSTHCEWDESPEKTEALAACIAKIRYSVKLLATECINLKEYISESVKLRAIDDGPNILMTLGVRRSTCSDIRVSFKSYSDVSYTDIMELMEHTDGRIKVALGARVIPRLDKNEFILTDDTGAREVKTLATLNACDIVKFKGDRIWLEGVDPLTIAPGSLTTLIENIRGRAASKYDPYRFASSSYAPQANIRISFCDFTVIPDHILEEMFSSMCGIEFVDSRPVYNSSLRRARYDGAVKHDGRVSTTALPPTDDISCIIRIPDTCVMSSKWSNNLAYVYSITRGETSMAASIKYLGANTVDPLVVSDNTPSCPYFQIREPHRLGTLLLGHDEKGIPIYSRCEDSGRLSDTLIRKGLENKNGKFSKEIRIGRRKSWAGKSAISLSIIGLKVQDNLTREEYLRVDSSLSLKALGAIIENKEASSVK
jgi:hypothetical protein